MYRHAFYRKGKVAVEFRADKKGVILRFAPAQDDRRFNWSQAVVFSLNVDECGELLWAMEGGREFRAYHVPPKGGNENAKVLSFRPARNEKEGNALTLLFPNKKPSPNFFISLSPGEVRALQVFLQESMKLMFEDDRSRRFRREGGSAAGNPSDIDENPF
ncbi:MAG: hypothetical protein QW687_02575 [Candidatus Hadarchaeales archaeon]